MLKRPGGRKDEMKLALLKLKSFIQHEHTDGGETAVDSPIPSNQDRDSESDKGSLGPGGKEP